MRLARGAPLPTVEGERNREQVVALQHLVGEAGTTGAPGLVVEVGVLASHRADVVVVPGWFGGEHPEIGGDQHVAGRVGRGFAGLRRDVAGRFDERSDARRHARWPTDLAERSFGEPRADLFVVGAGRVVHGIVEERSRHERVDLVGRQRWFDRFRRESPGVVDDPPHVPEVVVVPGGFAMTGEDLGEPPLGVGTRADVALPRRVELPLVAGHGAQCARLPP